MKINLKTAGIGLLACVSLTSKGEKPNIIYILADDLGYAELGCYGQEKIETPNIKNSQVAEKWVFHMDSLRRQRSGYDFIKTTVAN